MGTAAARPALLPWREFLPALEEWVRRTAELVRTGEQEPLPFAVLPDGPLPAELAVRARALHQQMQQLQALGSARRRELERAQVYASH